ncbi:MAG: hypothetical protein KatS3mg011_2170 [Acidimicrobiia bacterium]|nr:MAG: hypothetical protein KatS3mg011_2170 [Acidimicrobiia bacterium]
MSGSASREALYAELERVLGREHAQTLMSYLRPSDEMATRSDVQSLGGRVHTLGDELARVAARVDELRVRMDRLEERMDRFEQRFDRFEERLEARFEALAERMDRMQRFYVGTTVWSMTGLTAIFALVVGLIV